MLLKPRVTYWDVNWDVKPLVAGSWWSFRLRTGRRSSLESSRGMVAINPFLPNLYLEARLSYWVYHDPSSILWPSSKDFKGWNLHIAHFQCWLIPMSHQIFSPLHTKKISKMMGQNGPPEPGVYWMTSSKKFVTPSWCGTVSTTSMFGWHSWEGAGNPEASLQHGEDFCGIRPENRPTIIKIAVRWGSLQGFC